MYKIINQSARSFIVKAEDVIKGGKKGHKDNEKIIESGASVVEVSDELGENLSTYSGILIVEKPEGAVSKKKRK